MPTDRRFWLKGSLTALGAGLLSRVDKVAAMQGAASPSLTKSLKDQARGESEKLLLKPRPGEEGPPEPAKADRLPLDWNKATVKRLKDSLAERNIQAFPVGDPSDTIHL